MTSNQRGEAQISRTDYSYDLSGNRTEKIKDNATLHSYNTDANSNRLQSQSGAQTVNYSYDPAGNLTGDGTYSHSYNAAGRRITTTNTITGQTTQYFYDEQGHLTGEYDATGQLIQEIIWLGDLPVAVIKPATNSTATPDIPPGYQHPSSARKARARLFKILSLNKAIDALLLSAAAIMLCSWFSVNGEVLPADHNDRKKQSQNQPKLTYFQALAKKRACDYFLGMFTEVLNRT
ncbi:MAG: hypothetical protein WAW41_11085 [Methylobacter sp.]